MIYKFHSISSLFKLVLEYDKYTIDSISLKQKCWSLGILYQNNYFNKCIIFK